MVRHAELVELDLPDFGYPVFEPKLGPDIYLVGWRGSERNLKVTHTYLCMGIVSTAPTSST